MKFEPKCDYSGGHCVKCIVYFTKDMECNRRDADIININNIFELIQNNKIKNFSGLKKYKTLMRQLKIKILKNKINGVSSM